MSTAVRIWEDNFKILMKIRSKSERNALLFALVSYGFCGEIPQDLKLNKNNLLLFEVLKNNFIAKNQGGAPIGNFNRCSTVEKKENNQKQPLSENRKQKNNIPPKNKFSYENIILSPYKGKTQCSVCQRKAKFDINGQKFCGQHTRIELTKLGRLDLMPAERFEIPTLDEVKSYCQERNNGVDAERFIDFYSSKGWKVGNQPMKDWRAAVRTWERRESPAPASRKTANDSTEWTWG